MSVWAFMEYLKRLYLRIKAIISDPNNREKINYLIFGGLTTGIDYAVYFLLKSFLVDDRAYLSANGIAWVAAVSFAFITNKLIVFRSKAANLKALFREIGSFIAARLFSLLFSYVWMILAVETMHMNDSVAKVVSGVVVIIMNYFFSKVFIFRKSNRRASGGAAGGDAAGGGADGGDAAGGSTAGGDAVGSSAVGGGAAWGDAASGGAEKGDSVEGGAVKGGDAAGSAAASGGAANGWLQHYGFAILSFFIPVCLLLIAFAVIEVYPFGANSILIIDNHHQYTPFLLEFGKILREGGSLLHSWTAGLGSNYLSRFAYYLSSPLNLFAVFIDDSAATEFVLALVLFRAGAAGLAFFTYLKSKFRKQGFLTVAFAVMYSLCGYFLAYYWNIMWFDCIAIFPLVALGIEWLADRGSGVLYCLTLAYTIMSNYFIAIMVCIYSILYFIAYLASKAGGTGLAAAYVPDKPGAAAGARAQSRGFKTILHRIGGFVVYSALAGALSAIITLPAYMGLLGSSAAGAELPKTTKFYSLLIDIAANHLALIKPSIMVGLPNIYCGVAVLLLVPLYFINSRIAFREKVANGLLICFFILSFNVNTLDFLWHGTHFPNSLFFRFAFLYVFLVLTVAYHALMHIEATSGREVFAIFALLLAFIFFMEIQPAEKTTKWTIYGSLLFVIFEALALAVLNKKRRENYRDALGVYACEEAPGGNTWKGAPGGNAWEGALRSTGHQLRRSIKVTEFALAALICTEIAVNAGYGIGEAGIFPKQNYLMNTGDIKPAVNQVNMLEQAGGPAFERMEFTTHTTYNTPIIYGYKGVSYYSSTSYVAVNEMFGKLGLIHSNAWYVYRSAPPTFNSMFAIRYLLSQDGPYDNGIYKEIDLDAANGGDSDGGGDGDGAGAAPIVSAYENPYFLPVGFMAAEPILAWNFTQQNPLLCQEDFFMRASGINAPLFHRLNPRLESQENFIASSGGGQDGLVRYRLDDENRNAKAKYKVTSLRGGPIYFYVNSSKIDVARVQNLTASSRSGAEPAGVIKEHNIKYPYVIDAQNAMPGDEIEIELTIEKSAADSFTLYAYEFDEIMFNEVWKRLERQGLRVAEYTDTKLSGEIDVDAPGVMYTSIPYDDGWSATVDGEPATIETVGGGALIAVRLQPGRHTINFSYMTPGLVPGAVITVLAAFMLIGMLLYKSLAPVGK